jgi:peptidoglycan/LPS O-acetylase OafA/YrhL
MYLAGDRRIMDGMEESREAWRLGHRPALDVLRGVAVLMVIVGHMGVPYLPPPSGNGVVIFFVLSGFLITSLLLEERQRTGRYSLPAFYARRARRLLPAMLVCVACAVGVDLAVFGSVPDWNLVAGTLGYVANFVMMSGGWFPHTSLGHTWSLAIEEQFYILWPLLLGGLVLLRLRPARLVLAASLGAIIAWKALLFYGMGAGRDRLYFGTDVRFEPLLLGCLLAFLMHQTRVRAVSRNWEVYGWLLLVVACASTWSGRPGMQLAWVPTIVAASAGLLVYAAANDGARWMDWGPLAYLGKRSYALYLFQGPVFTVLRDQPWVPRPVYWIAVVPVLLVLAELSWRFVERPVLVRGRRSADLVHGEAAGRGVGRPVAATVLVVGDLHVVGGREV